MKKAIAILALSATIFSCEKATTTNEFKSAYIDSSKLMDESTEAKDIEAKYKAKAEEMGAQLRVEATKLEAEKNSFKSDAQKNGQAWAQQKYSELQQRDQQLQYAQQGMMQQLQSESGAEIDSLFSKYSKIFKQYGKDKGYDFIYGTGQVQTVLYAKDSYDITKEIAKIVNDKYKAEEKKDQKVDDKKDEKKEDKK